MTLYCDANPPFCLSFQFANMPWVGNGLRDFHSVVIGKHTDLEKESADEFGWLDSHLYRANDEYGGKEFATMCAVNDAGYDALAVMLDEKPDRQIIQSMTNRIRDWAKNNHFGAVTVTGYHTTITVEKVHFEV